MLKWIKRNPGETTLIAIYGFTFLVLIGWIINIFKLISMDGGISTLFILRIVGIFAAPLGAILGIFY